MARILVVNGPNLNLLGEREPDRYGRTDLAAIEARLSALAGDAGHAVVCFQSNAEHALIERVHAARADGTAFMVVNPAAFTHTSIALRDALLAVAIPFVEVHLSNIHAREPFRRRSYFSDIAVAVVAGAGALGYELALRVAVERLAPGT